MNAERVGVELGERSYSVLVGRGMLAGLGQEVRSVVDARSSRAFLVVDSGVPSSQIDALSGSLADAGFVVSSVSIEPTERVKSIATYERVLCAVASSGHGRVDPVIGVGGGIVCDIAGFVASSYRRGVPIVQCPTTLLAMVDASVGGKTGVNLAIEGGGLLKNLVGAFHQPRLVCADAAVLSSLEPRQMRAGLAECVKHAHICATVGHPDLGGWMKEHLDGIARFDGGPLDELIARNVALKASVVAGDEFEDPGAPAGGRMLLNFGHTFGHAIETIDGVVPVGRCYDGSVVGLLHGEAVGLGMLAACRCAENLGLCDPSIGERLKATLDTLGLPARAANLPGTGEIIARMGHDKKAMGSTLRVILPTGEGRCAIVEDAAPGAIAAGIDSIRG
ncbi:MAG: 3-dehydroquinate synthase [Phycisphaerales bacterium]|nr:3-dehydroquinate synthase [Phycisphaerales bacterium]